MSVEGATVFDEVAAELARAFEAPFGAWDAERFHEHALATFRFQYGANAVYRGFCDGRGVAPRDVAHWSDIPCVPAMAFKHLDLRSDDRRPDAVFRTSGTTSDGSRRGRHSVPDLALYEASLRPTFRRYLLGTEESVRAVSLIPSFEAAPESSLSCMVTAGMDAFGSKVAWVAEEAAIDVAAVRAAVRDATDDEPLLWLGTALSYVHLLGAIGDERLVSPEGSRLMETGGFKGVERTVDRTSLHDRIARGLGVDPDRIIGEYGMTELLSQSYEPMLELGPDGRGRYRPAPWLGVRAVEPTSLAPLPDGEEGLLAFYDLANLGSVCAVLTEDVGVVEGGSVTLLGRYPGAEPRGCSRAMDEILSVRAS